MRTSRDSRAELSLNSISVGHSTESLQITESHLQLAQYKEAFEVGSGNPYATDFLFVASLDQLLISRIFSHLWAFPNTLIFLYQVMFFPTSPRLLSQGSLHTWRCQLIKNLLSCQSYCHLWHSYPPWQKLAMAVVLTLLFAPFIISAAYHGIQNSLKRPQTNYCRDGDIKLNPCLGRKSQRDPERKGKWQGPHLSSMCSCLVTFMGLL